MPRRNSFEAYAPRSEPLYIVQDRQGQGVTSEGLYLGPQLTTTQLQLERSQRENYAARGVRALRVNTDDPRGIHLLHLEAHKGSSLVIGTVGPQCAEEITLFGENCNFSAMRGEDVNNLRLINIEALAPTLLLTRQALTDAFTEFHGATLRPNSGEDGYFPYPELKYSFDDFAFIVERRASIKALFALID
ncbi:MAG: hypothetical protein AAB383_05575 [Patescibacteria group bacterium]